MILASMFDQAFLRHAFVSGTFISIASGLVGYFLVVRNQVFAADALSHVAFTGSLAALAFEVNQRAGLLASTIAIALVLAALSGKRFLNDVAIGTTFSWLLGLGSLFLYLFTTHHSTSNAAAGPNILFGSIYGISTDQMYQAMVVSAVVITGTAIIARPLLYASIDSVVAAAQGVRVRGINTVFLVLLALQVAETVQLVGALLLLGLLATPAAAASRLTASPYKAMMLAAGLCLAAVLVGLTISYLAPTLPPSFVIVALTFVIYVVGTVWSRRSVNRAPDVLQPSPQAL